MKKQIYFTACVIVLASFIGIACASSGETTDVTAVRNIDNRFSTRTYNLSDFTGIDVSSVVKVIYTQGEKYSVKLTGRTDRLDYMDVSATNGTLKVHAKENRVFSNVRKEDKPDGEHNFILHLTAPSLQNICLEGVSVFESSRLSADVLKVHIDGVSAFKVKNIDCKSIDGNVWGVSQIEVEEMAAQDVKWNIGGTSKLNLSQMHKCENVKMDISGASHCVVAAKATGLMQVILSGASKSDLTFKGGNLRTVCSGASTMDAKVDCAAVSAICSGASTGKFSGTAKSVDVNASDITSRIETSQLKKK